MEIEYKLAILDPEVLAELAGRRELAGYALRSVKTVQLRDQFWDTPDQALGLRAVSLRLRQQDDALLFTIKGMASIENGLFVRPELEVPADATGLRLVAAELAKQGLRIDQAASSDRGGPADWLRSAGLQITQDRATDRARLIAEVDGQERAEFALDTTSYRVGPYEVLFREVEVESLTDNDQDVVRLAGALLETYKGRVLPSELGKYGRGLDLTARLG